MLVDHQAQQSEGYPYVFVPTARYDYIQNMLRAKGKWTLVDASMKVVNNLRRQFNKILRKAGIKKGTFHDIRRTAITMWFANGMSEHDVRVLAGHSSFAMIHEFHFTVADDLIHRARAITAQVLRENMVHFSAGAF
jgi:integrase